jgi:hypothetical protein
MRVPINAASHDQEGRSWTLTETDEPETMPGKPGTPTTDKSVLLDGSVSSETKLTLIGHSETFPVHLLDRR